MDCSPPGACVHGIFQARILEWVAMPSSRGYSQPRDGAQVSRIAGGFYTIWAIYYISCHQTDNIHLFVIRQAISDLGHHIDWQGGENILWHGFGYDWTVFREKARWIPTTQGSTARGLGHTETFINSPNHVNTQRESEVGYYLDVFVQGSWRVWISTGVYLWSGRRKQLLLG